MLFGHFVVKICQAYAVCYPAQISGKSRSIRNVHFKEGMDTFVLAYVRKNYEKQIEQSFS